MQDGLYKVDFRTPLGQGFGVVALDNGKLRGGDSAMFYVGAYSQNGDSFSAKVTVGTHSHVPGMGSVLGVSQGQMTLEGKSVGDSAVLNGSSPQAPGVAFSATLTPLAL